MANETSTPICIIHRTPKGLRLIPDGGTEDDTVTIAPGDGTATPEEEKRLDELLDFVGTLHARKIAGKVTEERKAALAAELVRIEPDPEARQALVDAAVADVPESPEKSTDQKR